MKKLKMARETTFTINHYRQSYVQFFKYFDPKMPIEDIDE